MNSTSTPISQNCVPQPPDAVRVLSGTLEGFTGMVTARPETSRVTMKFNELAGVLLDIDESMLERTAV